MANIEQAGPAKVWRLSQYDLKRKAVPLIHDRSVKVLTPASRLRNDFSCPICLDILRQTKVTKECLHRFCSECIIDALRKGNKECPTCRTPLTSKRSLRPDDNFDKLIAKLFPSAVTQCSVPTSSRSQRKATGTDDGSISSRSSSTHKNTADSDVESNTGADVTTTTVTTTTVATASTGAASSQAESSEMHVALKPLPTALAALNKQFGVIATVSRRIDASSRCSLEYLSVFLYMCFVVRKSGSQRNSHVSSASAKNGRNMFRFFLDSDGQIDLDVKQRLQSVAQLADGQSSADGQVLTLYFSVRR